MTLIVYWPAMGFRTSCPKYATLTHGLFGAKVILGDFPDGPVVKTSPSRPGLVPGPWSLSRSVVSGSLRPQGWYPTRLLCPWGFSRQKYWSGLPCPLPGDLPNPRIEPKSPKLLADSLPSEPPEKAWSLVGELRSHMPHGQENQNIKQNWYGNKFNKDFKNGPQ